MTDGATSEDVEGHPDDGSLSRVPEPTTGAVAETDTPIDRRAMFRVPTP